MQKKLKQFQVDPTVILVLIIIGLFILNTNGITVTDITDGIQGALGSILPSFGGEGDNGDDGSGDDGTEEAGEDEEPITPWITLDLSMSSVPHHPRTAVTGSVSSNAPNARIILEEKLRGDSDPYGISGWPHTWVETYSATTDGSGSASVPFTCVMPGMWEQRITLVDYGVSSDIENLEICGVAVDVPQEMVGVGEAITIRVFSSYYNTPEFTAYHSTDGWATSDDLAEVTTDDGGYSYQTLYTGETGTHEFRYQAPDGTWSYNTESCVVS